MKVGDHVYLDDSKGRNYGKITTRDEKGICHVKWDSGITERIHESELYLAASGLTPKQEEIVRNMDEDHSQDDPKHPTWRERLASLWDDFRLGK